MIFTLKWLFPYWKRHAFRMSSIVIFGILSAVLYTINPLLIKNIINGLSSNLNPGYIRHNVLLILGVGLGIYFTNLIAQRNRAYMNMRLEWEFRKKVFDHIIRLDQNFYHKYTTGDLVTRLADDISNKISWFSCSGVFRFIQSIFTIIAVISTMLYFNPVLTLWVLSPVPLILTFSIKTGRALTDRYTALQESITALYDFLETCFTGIRLIKANAKESSQEAFFTSKTSVQMAAEISTARLGMVFSFFFHYAGFFSVVILYIVGGRMVIDGRSTLGELIAFQFYSGMIIGPLMDIVRATALPRRGLLLHSWNGPVELVPELAKLGAYFSFSAHHLIPRKADLRVQFAAAIPRERILVETDAPALCPAPEFRVREIPPSADGTEQNHPSNLVRNNAELARTLEQEGFASLAEQVQARRAPDRIQAIETERDLGWLKV